jgi:hypothetical protein
MQNILFGKYKYPILVLIAIFLFAPKPTLALWGVGDFGIFDIPDQILGGIEEKTGPVFTAVATILIAYMAGLAALSLSGQYLQQFISQQDGMITALEPMTRAGWDFSAGLANMLLVVIFIIIAFAFIFKIETFQAKKSLPKLIVVALLINFSFLFVQMLVDISQVLYNTVLPETPIFPMIMDVLISPGESVIATVFSWMAALGVSLAIPVFNAFTQIVLSTLFTVLLLPNIIIWIVQAIFFWLLALMFFFFVFLFAARVFVLQMLMIVAPLAFVCLILPKTESFWRQWFKMLMEWLLLGIFFLFFLVLGFGALSLMRPSVDPLPLPGASLFKLGGFLVYYFVVFVYMAVILFIGKKFIPSGAKALIDFGKGIAGTVVTRGLKPIGRQLKERTMPRAQEDLAKSERIKKMAGAMAQSRTPIGRWAGRTLGSGMREASKKNIAKIKNEAEKIEDAEYLRDRYLSAKTDNERMAYLSTAIKKGKAFKKPFETMFKEDDTGEKKKQAIQAAKAANQIEATPDAERIARAFLHTAENETERDNMLKDMGFVGKKSKTSKELVAEAKGDDIKDFNKELWKNKDVQDTIYKHWTGEKVGAAGREFHEDFLDEFRTGMKREGKEGEKVKQYLAENKSLSNYLTSSAARGLGVGYEETTKETPKEAPKIYPGTEEEFRKAREDKALEEKKKRESQNK